MMPCDSPICGFLYYALSILKNQVIRASLKVNMVLYREATTLSLSLFLSIYLSRACGFQISVLYLKKHMMKAVAYFTYCVLLF
jgi:hypothetical protein